MPKQADRNGAVETEAVSNAPSPEDSPKQVVFRSKDAELKLVKSAGYMDKSQGMAEYVPTTGVQFMDFYLRIDDVPENKKIIDWVRKHQSNGIAFREIPEVADKELLPPISELEDMSVKELREMCGNRKIEVVDDSAGKDTLILALLKSQ